MLRDAVKTSTTLAIVLAWFLLYGPPIHAQATGFTYQGQLTDGGSPAMGQYDLTFALFRAPEGGSQIGGDLVRHDVQVNNGVFSVDLDFGTSPFTSPAGSHLEIAVRAGASTGAYTALLPRKPITNSPYAVQTIRATSGAVAGAGDAPEDLSGIRTPARSGNDLQSVTDEPSTVDVSGGRGLWASHGRFPDIFAAPAWPAGRRARGRPALDFGLGTVRATERSSQGTPGEYRIHVITPFSLGLRVQTDTVGGDVASFGGVGNFRIDAPKIAGGRFSVRESGNVGIGTDSPAEKLSVAGTIHSTSGGFKFPDGSVLTTATGTGNYIHNTTTLQTGASFNISGNGLLGGALGIGTTSPLAKLDLLGGAGNDGSNDPRAMAFQFAGGGYRHWIRTRHNSVLGSGNAIDFFVNDSTSPGGSSGPGLGSGSAHVMTLDSGRVGIGELNPTEKLTVAGTVQSTSGGFKFPDGSRQTTAASVTYATSGSGSFGFPSDGTTRLTILQLDLPAGNYLLWASAKFDNRADFFGQNNSRDFNCVFNTDGVPWVFRLAGGTAVATTMHTVLNISGRVSVDCLANGPGVWVEYRRLTAMKLENLVVQ